MKAIQFERHGEPDVLEIVDLPIPEAGPGEVLVRVHAAGVNPADYKWRNGFNLRYFSLPLPHVPGYDIAGTVTAVGEGVSGFAVGDRVFATVNGAYAEYAIAPQQGCARIPEGVDFVQAAALPCPALTGMELVELAIQPKPGQTVLVTGATGGVGRFAAKAVKDLGATLVAAVRPAYGEEARSLGFDHVIAFGEPLPDDLRFDHVADTVGGDEVARMCRNLKPGGLIRTVATTPIDPAGLPAEPQVFGYQSDGERLARIVAAVADGSMPMPVARTFPLAEAGAAQDLVEHGGARGRVVIVID